MMYTRVHQPPESPDGDQYRGHGVLVLVVEALVVVVLVEVVVVVVKALVVVEALEGALE